ncbi:MAG: paraquat-inducible protein A [Paracoccaceae bacterium]|nr:paraquat-inducible protein A [Paracoccaceae bacterium]
MPVRPVVVPMNLALLALYPASWFAPLAHAGILPFFSGNEITIIGGVQDLWEADAALAILVAVFAVVIPYGKTLFLAAVHFRLAGTRALGLIEIIAKLSMADVFLIALYIVMVKGIGFGHVASAWGLWLFTGCVLASIWAGFETRRKLAEWT